MLWDSLSETLALPLDGGRYTVCPALYRNSPTVEMNMRAHQNLGFIGMFGLTLFGLAQVRNSQTSAISSYGPAFLERGQNTFGDEEKLVILSTDPTARTTQLPFRTAEATPSLDGSALYAARFFDPPQSRSKMGLYRIEFGPARANPVEGSGGLVQIFGLSASVNKIVVSAGYLNSVGLLDEKSCAMYELTLATGSVRKILSNSDCKYESAWRSISISPDERQVVAVRRGNLVLVNLTSSEVRSLGEGFLAASWSPNGRWIAALKNDGRNRTQLFDTSNFSKLRELSSSEVVWSPDSQHIVKVGQQSRCGGFSGTLQLIDIETGAISTMPGSTCKVHSQIIGWINVAGQ